MLNSEWEKNIVKNHQMAPNVHQISNSSPTIAPSPKIENFYWNLTFVEFWFVYIKSSTPPPLELELRTSYGDLLHFVSTSDLVTSNHLPRLKSELSISYVELQIWLHQINPSPKSSELGLSHGENFPKTTVRLVRMSGNSLSSNVAINFMPTSTYIIV